MGIVSTAFLFLFLPAAMGLYFLIPCRNGLTGRNVFLLLASLFFYAWGEPAFVLLWLLLIVAVWLLGRMAEAGRGGPAGRWAVALTVMMCVGVLLAFAYMGRLLGALGLLLGRNVMFLETSLPLGLAFFAFHAIAYVVDIYRGQCHSPRHVLHTALYLSVFFKVLQGPIVSYRAFEPQIATRCSSWRDVSEGLWRYAVGLGKKMIVAANLAPMVDYVFDANLQGLPLADAWMGCVAFLVFMYFDFSGYSDMAIGLGRVFGFRVPENFNFPYVSTSVAEYWRRWHITLIDWFRDYLFFPILLGPSVRLRKWMLRRGMADGRARRLQNVFVPACVWTVTALWHGANWNYTLWGLLNCAAIVVEPHLPVLRNDRANRALRWMGVMLFLLLSVPLIYTDTLQEAGWYLRALFAGSGCLEPSLLLRSHLRGAWPFLLVGLVGCFPVLPWLKHRCYPSRPGTLRVVWDAAEVVLLMAVVIVALGFLFQSSEVWFLYQK